MLRDNNILTFVLVFMAILFFSCTPEDADGNVYGTVQIGNQCWTLENLKTTHYRNGDPIPCVTDSATWVNLTTGAYCDYNNDPSNADTYGRLYNWYAVNDSRGIAPVGWHIPTNEEWLTLEECLGGSSIAGSKMKVKYTNNPPWDGSNSSGFSALPAGLRFNGKFTGLGDNAHFWSITQYNTLQAINLYINSFDFSSAVGPNNKSFGYSIRCIRD